MSGASSRRSDPRRPNEIVYFRPPAPSEKNGDPSTDAFMMASLLFGLGATLLKKNWAAWLGLFSALLTVSNSSRRTDKRTVAACVVFVLFGFISTMLERNRERLFGQ